MNDRFSRFYRGAEDLCDVIELCIITPTAVKAQVDFWRQVREFKGLGKAYEKLFNKMIWKIAAAKALTRVFFCALVKIIALAICAYGTVAVLIRGWWIWAIIIVLFSWWGLVASARSDWRVFFSEVVVTAHNRCCDAQIEYEKKLEAARLKAAKQQKQQQKPPTT